MASLCDHASQINSEYPGGLKQYVQNAKTLLDNSTKGINPYDGFTPSIPEGKNLEFGTKEFCKYEAIGLKELKHAGFVLVAGGLGERLGYEYIKISLHSEISTETPFIELYIKTILSYQQRTEATMLPLFIMTSDRTDEMTRKMLAENNYYGMKKEQITICKQNAVPAMVNKDGLFAYENGKIVTKPHGHGDVHLLMHQSGTASKWYEMGINWVVFFQDTNGLAFHGIPACVGVAKDMDLEVNSLAVRRYAKEKVGAICKLSHKDGRGLTINVEYNQLDPLLRATVNKDGDVPESNGFSPYPGNINVLCMKLKNYSETLEESGGSIPEFVNPKFNPDNTFKSPTRLECMMQDYPKLLGPKSKVGFTSMERWLVFSAVKNDLTAAKNAAASCGVEESAASGERDIYKMHVAHLNAAGCHVEEGAHVVIDPSVGVTYSELTSRFGGGVYITKRSTLVVKGDVRIENLELDGTLVIQAKEDTHVVIRHLKIKNDGWEFIKVDENDENEPAWNRIRGYCLDKKGDSVRIYCGGEFVVDEF